MDVKEGENMKTNKKKLIRRRKRGKRQFVVWILLMFLCILLWETFLTREYTIALDPGHGGSDSGAVGVIKEVDLTEQTATFLEERLEKDGRFHVVRTRENGEGKSLANRKRKIWISRPDIVLSIHANADSSGTATGFECYAAPPIQKNHEKSLRFGEMIADEMKQAGSSLRGENGVRYGYYIPDEYGIDQKNFKESSDKTPYQYASFAMIEGFSCPAVLVEQCFVNSPSDVAKFGTEAGCQKAAEAYYKGICRTFGLSPTDAIA